MNGFIWNKILDIIFPRSCALCNEGLSLDSQFESLCDTCFLRIREALYTFDRLRFVDRLVSYGSYHDPLLRDAISSFKYRGVQSLAKPLSLLETRAMEEAGVERLYHQSEPPVYTFIPLHPLKERFRGYNQSRVLAAEVALYFFSPLVPLFGRTGLYPAQASIASERDRRKNTKGSLKLLVSRVPQTVIIVDDVATSGATLNEAGKLLKKAGAHTVWGVVAARG